MNSYRLYIKFPGDKRFLPVDWSTGTVVHKLIHATVFTEEEIGLVERYDLTRDDNAGIEYEFRPVKGW